MIFHTLFTGKDWVAPREFTYSSCQLDLAGAFEMVTLLVTEGWTILQVRLQVEGTWIDLPVAAFDGQPMGFRLRELQTQWETILNQPQ